MNKKKRELLKQQHLKEHGVKSADQFLDLMTKPSDRRTLEMINIGDDWGQKVLELIFRRGVYTELDSLIELCLAGYKTRTAQRQREFIKSLSDLARTRKWAWDTLIELIRREPITPTLKSTFVLPVLERKRKAPDEDHGYGRTPNNVKNAKDPGRDFRLVTWVIMLRKIGFTVEETCEIVAKRKEIALSTSRTKEIYYEFRKLGHSKNQKRTTPQSSTIN